MEKANYLILPSKLNKMQPVDVPKEKFEVLKSEMNFDLNEFIECAKDQMYEMQIEFLELSKATYIGETRLRNIISKKSIPTEEEIKEIRKRLHLSV